MRAMVLAAGLGMRLRPLTDSTPKPLIDVGGRPMIAYGFDLARRAGITEIAVNLHHLGDQLRQALGDGSRFGVRLTYFEEATLLETGGGIAAAREFLRQAPFVVLNSDTITDVDLPAMIERHHERQSAVTLMLRPDPEAARYGVIEIDARERVRRFLGHTPPDFHETEASGLRGLMFGGVHVIEPRIFDYMEDGAYSITRVTYPRLLAAGEAMHAFVHTGFWQVLDTPDGLREGRERVATQMSK